MYPLLYPLNKLFMGIKRTFHPCLIYSHFYSRAEKLKQTFLVSTQNFPQQVKKPPWTAWKTNWKRNWERCQWNPGKVSCHSYQGSFHSCFWKVGCCFQKRSKGMSKKCFQKRTFLSLHVAWAGAGNSHLQLERWAPFTAATLPYRAPHKLLLSQHWMLSSTKRSEGIVDAKSKICVTGSKEDDKKKR